AFEVVQIGSRNAELVGHLALVETALAAQPLHSRAEKELSLSHVSACHDCYNIHKSESVSLALFGGTFTSCAGSCEARTLLEEGTIDERLRTSGGGPERPVRRHRAASQRARRAEAARVGAHRAHAGAPRRAEAVGAAAPGRAGACAWRS